MDKLVIQLTSDESRPLDEYFPGFELSLEADVTNLDVHAWFKIFEKVLLAQGFDTYVIQKGGLQLAFNEWRDSAKMRKLHKEFDLDEFREEE